MTVENEAAMLLLSGEQQRGQMMNKRYLVACVLGLTTLSCNKLTKEDAEAAVSAYYANNGREECTADVEAVTGVSGFACRHYRCNECADALVREGLASKTDDPKVYRFMRTAMNVDVGKEKLIVYCARKSAIVSGFSNKGDFGTIRVEETTEPDAKAKDVERACGLRIPDREARSRSLRVKRNDDGIGWTVLH